MGIGAGVLVFVGIGSEGIPEISTRGWLLIAWLAVVNTAFAFTLWNHTLRRLSAVESASINNTMLVQIALLAWLFLGEAPGIIGVAGIVLVSVGVFLTQDRGRAALNAAANQEAGDVPPGSAPD
jgi:drug/metabolite transporter (DMT)-like permease